MRRKMAGFVGVALLAGTAIADDWPGFRGPTGMGLSAEKRAPAEWGPQKNVKWKVALPEPGNGSPIVSGGRVFLTCPEDSDGVRRSLYCYDRKDGKQLWVRTVDFKKMPRHKTNPHSSSTPAADGKRVVVWHDSAGLFCYDFEGKELWSRKWGDMPHEWAHGVSPVIYKDKVILNFGPAQRVFVTALDAATGKTLWETDEPVQGRADQNRREGGGYLGSWCTPVIAKVDGKDQILCAHPHRLVAYHPEDGKILWWSEGLRHKGGDLAYASPVVTGDVVMYVGGFGGPGFAVRMSGAKGDVTETHRLWRTERNPQCIGSGVALGGYVYHPWAGPGRIDCIDPKTGKALWQERVGAAYWGSIVQAGGLCYVTDQQGATAVFRPSPEKFDRVAVNRLNEESNSTPAISDGEIFLRTFKHLYCIAE